MMWYAGSTLDRLSVNRTSMNCINSPTRFGADGPGIEGRDLERRMGPLRGLPTRTTLGW
jgi:hypothetical protein